jgi:hypothetical protein
MEQGASHNCVSSLLDDRDHSNGARRSSRQHRMSMRRSTAKVWMNKIESLEPKFLTTATVCVEAFSPKLQLTLRRKIIPSWPKSST